MIHCGDCLTVLASLEPESVDACVTDPPYGLEFMGKAWDRPWAVTATAGVGYSGREDNLTLPSHRDGRNANCRACGGRARGAKRCTCATPEWDRAPGDDMRAFQAWSETWAREVLRVLKPGGHLLAFGGTRTYHRMTCAIEDTGFEVRDCLMFVYGSGFPKSLDVSKAIDKAAGAERVQTGREPRLVTPRAMAPGGDRRAVDPGARFDDPVTDAAQQWAGWGTALKPAYEPIVLARKPLIGTVAANVQQYGTGAINVDACRIEAEQGWHEYVIKTARPNTQGADINNTVYGKGWAATTNPHALGRWPTNVLHDGSEEVLALFPQTGVSSGGRIGKKEMGVVDGTPAGVFCKGDPGFGDSGSAARFFYCAKPSREERDMGCHSLPARSAGDATDREDDTAGLNSPRAGAGRTGGARNIHPTVKPVELMRWLVRLITPPGGTVLDPFAGSGTTGMACAYEQRAFIGIEREAEYVAIAERRIAACVPLFTTEKAAPETLAPGATQADLLGGDAA